MSISTNEMQDLEMTRNHTVLKRLSISHRMAITRNLIDHNTITIHIPGIFSAFKVVSATMICTPPPQGGGLLVGGGGGLYMTNVPHDQYLRGTTKSTKT